MVPTLRSHQYDLVVFGAGCAGLSLLTRLAVSGWTKGRKILLVEKDSAITNDRTWCFWEKKPGFFEHLVYRKWDQLAFYSPDFSSQFSIAPYTYKMIRGIDFYRYCFHVITERPEIEIAYGEATGMQVSGDKLSFILNETAVQIRCSFVFSSIMPVSKEQNRISLLQHFKGWFVRTAEPCFNAESATFMDFRISQKDGTAFVYVLPLSETEALVEYTLFSREILSPGSYAQGLREYMREILQTENYEIIEEEFGVIPMTSQELPVYEDGIYFIGTAGGQTKASTGYTFSFIQQQVHQIADKLIAAEIPPKKNNTPWRFRFYDNTLLYILYHQKITGHDIFTRLFRKNNPQALLAFLDNKSSVSQELGILSSLPAWPFLKAAIKKPRPKKK